MPATTLAEVVSAIGGSVHAISGINTVQTPITASDSDRTPFVGTANDPDKLRDEAGVSGLAIRELGLDFVRQVGAIRGEHTFDVIGMGGVMSVADVESYMRLGAAAVQSATAACLHPNLPLEIAEYASITPPAEKVAGAGTPTRLQRFAKVLSTGGYSLLSNDR
jgi:dihydroorotate dehydrogenase